MGGRKKQNKELKKMIAIFCEGETEEIYFSHLSRKYKCSNVKIKTLQTSGQTLHLVENAIKKLTNDTNFKNYKILKKYVVFDKDDQNDTQISQAMKLARENNFNVCFSNECFDLWLLMHFEKVMPDSNYTRQIINKKLTKHLGVKWENNKANKLLLMKFIEKESIAMENYKHICDSTMAEKTYTDTKKAIEDIFRSL